MTQTIRVAHSPDSDDAFMFYALAAGKLDTGGLRFEHVLADIETLNQKAKDGVYEVTAISIHAYAHLAGRYALLPHGASMGERYGPLVVAREPLEAGQLEGKRIAIPGLWTSAYLALRLFQPQFAALVTPFDRIGEVVRSGEADAGVLIHEGQLTYETAGLHKVLDLGVWWQRESGGLPLPLGGNAIRKDLGADHISAVNTALRRSIEHALHHRQEALTYAMDYGRGIARETADRFVGMYVNDYTLDYGPRGRRAVELFLRRGFEAGLIPHRVAVEFAS